MKDVVDNKKKWRVVAITAFSLAFPYMVQNLVSAHCALFADLGGLKILLGPLLHLGLPAVVLWFLPYRQQARIIVIAVYIALFFAYAGLDCIPA